MVVNSLSDAWKYGPLSPKWIIAKEMKRIVDEDKIGLHDLLSFANFFDSAALRTQSKLLLEEDKHDLVSPEAMTMYMAESILWTSLPRAMMSPGRDLSMRRYKGYVKTLDVGNAMPPRLGLERTNSFIARLNTSCA